MWLHLLLDQQLTTLDNLENLAEMNRGVLEQCGTRTSLDACVVFLCASRMAIIHDSGIAIDDIQISLNDLYLSSPKMRTLNSFWRANQDQQQAQVLKAIDFLKSLYIRRPESRVLALTTCEMLLIATDILNAKPDPNGQSETLEISLQSWTGF